jgi:hypothetical protein
MTNEVEVAQSTTEPDAGFLAEPSAVAESFASADDIAAPAEPCDDCGSLTFESDEPAPPPPPLVPANEMWLPLTEIIKMPKFLALDLLSKNLAVAFWKFGSRLEAAKLVLRENGTDVDDETLTGIAEVVAERFDRGNLADILDDMTGVTARTKFLQVLARAVNDKRTTKAQIAGLTLQAEILGLLPKE